MAAPPALISATSELTSSPSTDPTTTSSSTTSHSSQQPSNTASTIAPQNVASSSPGQPSSTGSSAHQDHRLSNGAVAGIVIGVALGLALLTFLATFFVMRRQRLSKGNRRPKGGKVELNKTLRQDPTTASATTSTTAAPNASGTYESYLPQSADDGTIQQKFKATLDQIELHVENFYRNSSSSSSRLDSADLAVFDSPYLPASLARLLPHAKNRVNIIKHALTQSATSSISPGAGPTRSFLPTEYTLLPSTIVSASSSVPAKAGECHSTRHALTDRRTMANST